MRNIVISVIIAAFLLPVNVGAQSLPDGATIEWAEQFDTLDPVWKSGLPWGLDYDSGLARYRPSNSVVANGILTITAIPNSSGDPSRPFTSGHLHTCHTKMLQYGWIFARIRSDGLPGEWFNLSVIHDVYSIYGVKEPHGTFEINLHETQGTRPTQILQNFHSWTPHHYAKQRWVPVSNVSDWKIVGIRWSPSSIRYYVNGVKTHEVDTPLVRFPACLSLGMTVGGWERGNYPVGNQQIQGQIDWIHWYTWKDRVFAN